MVRRPGTIAALLVPLLLSGCGDGSSLLFPEARTLEGIVPPDQEGVAGGGIQQPPAVRVKDGAGNPVPGVPIYFNVTRGEGRIDREAVVSNDSGISKLDHWILGDVAGANWVVAHGGNEALGEIVFRATSRPGPPAAITTSVPNPYEGRVGAPLFGSLAVFVRDRLGNVVSGVPVRFRVVSGGGSIQSSQTTTSGTGRASAGRWTLGTKTGVHVAEASIEGLPPLLIEATGLPGPARPAEILATPAPVGEAGQVLVDPVALVFRDEFDNAIPGLLVKASVVEGGGVTSPASGPTDEFGRFVLTLWELGPQAGSNRIEISAPGVAPLFMHVTTTPAAPHHLALVEGNGQAAAPGGLLPIPPAVRVVDRFGNPIADRLVTFAIIAGGGGAISAGSVVSDATGVARAGPWQLGPDPGVQVLEARLEGQPGAISYRFEAESVAGNLRLTEITEGADQRHHAGYPVPRPPVARVTDGSGLAEPGVEVFFEVLAGDGEVFPSETVTDAGGFARVASWQLGSDPGPNTLLVRTRGGEAVLIDAEGLTPFHVSVAGIQLNQGNQSVTGSAAAVAERAGVLRVFPIATLANAFTPSARITLFLGSVRVFEEIVPVSSAGIPMMMDAGSVPGSFDLSVPATFVQPGLGVRVEIDPAGTLDVADRDPLVFPGPGQVHPLDVRSLPPFAVTFVPIHSTELASTGRITEANAEQYLLATRLMLPVSEVDFLIHPPYTSSAGPFTGVSPANGWISLVQEIQALKTAEGSDRYYHGILHKTVPDGPTGVAYRPPQPTSALRSALSADALPEASVVIAHEFGHGLGQRHAPCGGAEGVEPTYPYQGAVLATPGWDAQVRELLVASSHRDLMSYCSPAWISDFMYMRMLDWRLAAPPPSLASASLVPAEGGVAGSTQGETDGILLWGGWSRSGPELNPVFHLRASPTPVSTNAEGEVVAFDAVGDVIFRVPIAGEELSDIGDETLRHFSLFVPMATAQSDAIARVVLSTPFGDLERRVRPAGEAAVAPSVSAAPVGGGRMLLQWDDSAYPILMIRDAESGTILSFARNGRIEIQAPSTGALDIQLGEGIRIRRETLRFR